MGTIIIDVNLDGGFVVIISPSCRLSYRSLAGAIARAMRYIANAPGDPAQEVVITRNAIDQANALIQG